MTTRIVVFPVNGRKWAFSAVAQAAGSGREQAASLRQLLQQMSGMENLSDRLELATHFVSDKMHGKWTALQDAPENSIRHRIYNAGQRLLARLQPSESFLKTIPRDTHKIEIIYPRSMNPRLVRRRVRHIAHSGTVVHQRLMYGSFALLPFTVILGVLPMPNLPLFWNVFRAHAHWRALQGSKRLQSLVTNGSVDPQISSEDRSISEQASNDGPANEDHPWVLVPSEKLENLVDIPRTSTEAIEDMAIESICEEYQLDSTHVMRWRDH